MNETAPTNIVGKDPERIGMGVPVNVSQDNMSIAMNQLQNSISVFFFC